MTLQSLYSLCPSNFPSGIRSSILKSQQVVQCASSKTPNVVEKLERYRDLFKTYIDMSRIPDVPSLNATHEQIQTSLEPFFMAVQLTSSQATAAEMARKFPYPGREVYESDESHLKELF